MSPMTVGQKEAMEKATEIMEKAQTSFGGGLAQLKHIRTALKDGVGPEGQAVLDKHIAEVTHLIEDLSVLDLSK